MNLKRFFAFGACSFVPHALLEMAAMVRVVERERLQLNTCQATGA